MSKTPKASRSKYLTHCPDCDTTQGVVRDSYNKSPDHERWRLTKHTNWQTHQICTNARAIVHANVVFPNEERNEPQLPEPTLSL